MNLREENISKLLNQFKKIFFFNAPKTANCVCCATHPFHIMTKNNYQLKGAKWRNRLGRQIHKREAPGSIPTVDDFFRTAEFRI